MKIVEMSVETPQGIEKIYINLDAILQISRFGNKSIVHLGQLKHVVPDTVENVLSVFRLA